MTFGAAVELSVAMPLSWLPLISDYTREAEKPVQATAVSAVVYGLVSCWMYVIGMGAAIFTGETDIAQIMVKAGLGIAGLLIIVFSTVTTTFLDAYSAGISSESLGEKIHGKWVAVVVTVIGIAGAILFPMDDITDFLYFIGSVFAPMIAIQIADFFILKLSLIHISGGLDTVAVRMPSDGIAAAFIRAAGGFIAAPSANVSGRPSTTTAAHVIEDLSGRIEMILDGGQAVIGLESTIVDMSVEPPVILRPGAITKDMMEAVIGPVAVSYTHLLRWTARGEDPRV